MDADERHVRVMIDPVSVEDADGRALRVPSYGFDIGYPAGMSLFAASAVETLSCSGAALRDRLGSVSGDRPPLSELDPLTVSATTGDGAPVDVTITVFFPGTEPRARMRGRAYADALIALTTKRVLDALADAIIGDGDSRGDMSVLRGVMDDAVDDLPCHAPVSEG